MICAVQWHYPEKPLAYSVTKIKNKYACRTKPFVGDLIFGTSFRGKTASKVTDVAN